MTAAERQQAAAIDGRAGVIVQEKNKKQAEYLAAAFDRNSKSSPPRKREELRVAFTSAGDKRSPEQQKLWRRTPV